MLGYPPLTQHIHIQTDGDYTKRVVGNTLWDHTLKNSYVWTTSPPSTKKDFGGWVPPVTHGVKSI